MDPRIKNAINVFRKFSLSNYGNLKILICLQIILVISIPYFPLPMNGPHIFPISHLSPNFMTFLFYNNPISTTCATLIYIHVNPFTVAWATYQCISHPN